MHWPLATSCRITHNTPVFPALGVPYPIIADEGGEVGCLQGVQHLDEVATVQGVTGSETAAWKEAQLQKVGGHLRLGCSCNQTKQRLLFPSGMLLTSPPTHNIWHKKSVLHYKQDTVTQWC